AELRKVGALPDAPGAVLRLPPLSPPDEDDDPHIRRAAGGTDPASGPQRVDPAVPDLEDPRVVSLAFSQQGLDLFLGLRVAAFAEPDVADDALLVDQIKRRPVAVPVDRKSTRLNSSHQ